jgi:hypothetical protein
MHPHRPLECCVSGAFRKAASRCGHRHPCCTSRRAPKGAVEERIHRLDDGVPIGWFARQEQAAADETLDVSIVQFQPIAAKAVAAALSAPPHPLSSTPSGDLGGCDNRGGNALVDRPAPSRDILQLFARSAKVNPPVCRDAGNRLAPPRGERSDRGRR